MIKERQINLLSSHTNLHGCNDKYGHTLVVLGIPHATYNGLLIKLIPSITQVDQKSLKSRKVLGALPSTHLEINYEGSFYSSTGVCHHTGL